MYCPKLAFGIGSVLPISEIADRLYTPRHWETRFGGTVAVVDVSVDMTGLYVGTGCWSNGAACVLSGNIKQAATTEVPSTKVLSLI